MRFVQVPFIEAGAPCSHLQQGASMNRIFNAKPLLAAAIAIGALAAATAAQARSDVVFSIGLNAPYGYAQPTPVYVQPQPVYVQPEPVYYESQPFYYAPQPAYYGHRHRWHERRGAWGDADRDGVPNRYDRDSRFYDTRAGYRPWGDADRDGVPNRYDRAPNNPYRR
jgi:hypothetical protein